MGRGGKTWVKNGTASQNWLEIYEPIIFPLRN